MHVGKTRQAAVESFRKSQMNKHLVSLAKSTLKGQGAATHEDINLIGTPAEIVDKANAFREAGVTHLLGLYFADNTVQELLDRGISTPVRAEPQIGLEEIDADEVVMRIEATPAVTVALKESGPTCSSC